MQQHSLMYRFAEIRVSGNHWTFQRTP